MANNVRTHGMLCAIPFKKVVLWVSLLSAISLGHSVFASDSDADLSRIDSAISEYYSQILNADIGEGKRNYLKTTQRRWINEKNPCRNKICALNSTIHSATLKLDKSKDIAFLCDFKSQVPNFYTIVEGKPTKITDVGLESLTPIYNKFVGLKAVSIELDNYLFGYFLSIHDTSEEIAPNPVGEVYVKRHEVLCVDIEKLF
jgi:hypothetical protein